MKVFQKLKSFFEAKAKYWYVIVAITIILEIANQVFLSIVAPEWLCACVSILLVLIMTCYIAIICDYIKNRYNTYMSARKEVLLERISLLEKHLAEMNEKNIELETKLADAIQNNLQASTGNITKLVHNSCDSLETHMTSFKKETEQTAQQNFNDIIKKITDRTEIIVKCFSDSEGISAKRNAEHTKLIQEESKMLNDKISELLLTNASLSEDFIVSIQHLESALGNKIDETFKSGTSLANDIKQSITLLNELQENNGARISKEVSEYASHILNELTTVESMNNENAVIQKGYYEEIRAQLAIVVQCVEEKAEAISLMTTDMQNELTKMLIQVLHGMDDNEEKNKFAYDRIFNQVFDFSRVTESSIDTLKHTLEIQQLTIDNNREIAEKLADEQFVQINGLQDKVDIYSKVLEEYQDNIYSRLSNLQNQIVNLNSLAEVIKKISPIMAGNKVSDEILNKKGNTGPNHTEEVMDVESGIVVVNHYITDNLVSSEMLSGNKKTYEVKYDAKGRIVQSYNYGTDGELLTELHFYENGQVKKRIENKSVNGKIEKVISTFDEYGNKLR